MNRLSHSNTGGAVLVLTFLLCGCAPHLSQQRIEKQKAAQMTQTDQNPPSVPPQMGFSPSLETDTEKERLFSFCAKDMALEDALDVLSGQAKLALIWDKGINTRTPICATFKDYTLTEALDAIFAPTEYSYAMNSPTLQVKLLDTKEFELGNIPFKITTNMQAGGNVLGSIPNTGGISGQFQLSGSTDQDAVDLWKQAEEGIKNFLSSDGKYSINRLAGIVSVTDHKKNLKLVDDFIQTLKESLNRQVLIEAEVVEVTLQQNQSWGIDWSTVQSVLIGKKNVNFIGSQNLGLPGSVLQFTASEHSSDVVLDVLGKFGDLNVLSKPRLSVMNGQTALINMGKVLTYWELTGVAAGSEVGSAIIYPTQKTVMLGLTMGVTPYISSDDHVTMQVLPIVTDANSWSEFQFQNQTLKAPNLEIRETSTRVRVSNGETIVIGGLITSKKNNSEDKVPILGDIPLLGYFFKRMEKVEQKSELVIFLTPRITKSDRSER
jgi:MSHA biogenesis protein MshL